MPLGDSQSLQLLLATAMMEEGDFITVLTMAAKVGKKYQSNQIKSKYIYSD